MKRLSILQMGRKLLPDSPRQTIKITRIQIQREMNQPSPQLIIYLTIQVVLLSKPHKEMAYKCTLQ